MPEMTKKHFIALADAIRCAGLSKDQLGVLANFCQSMNPAFNRTRWFDYIAGLCGPSGGYKEKRLRVPKTHPKPLTKLKLPDVVVEIDPVNTTVYEEISKEEFMGKKPSFEDEIKKCYRGAECS